MDKNLDDENLITCVESIVSTCKKLLKHTMQQTNEKSSKMLSDYLESFDFEDISEGEKAISITALKAQLDTKLFLENECIETLAVNKQLRGKLDELEQKHRAERKKFQMVLNAGKEDMKILQDKLTKLSKENNHLKRKVIPTWQVRHASSIS